MRKLVFVLIALILSACAPGIPAALPPTSPVLVIYTSLPKEMVSPVPTWRVLFPPTPTPTSLPPTATPTIEGTPTQTDPGCMKLLEPANGASITKHERIHLKWSNVPGAKIYVILLEHPGGLQERLQAAKNELTLDLIPAQSADAYSWSVLVYDAGYKLICYSATSTLTLFPDANIPATETPTAYP